MADICLVPQVYNAERYVDFFSINDSLDVSL